MTIDKRHKAKLLTAELKLARPVPKSWTPISEAMKSHRNQRIDLAPKASRAAMIDVFIHSL